MSLAGLLFLDAFWNGGVSVFVLLLLGLTPVDNPPQGWEWWGLFVFPIPFEAIGLGMFAALVFVVLEPFRRTAWRFARYRFVRRTQWPVFRRTRVWQVTDLDWLELRRRRRHDVRLPRLSDITSDLTGQTPFELAFISINNVDLCHIASLTEGEARWMARIVLERRPKWFAR